MDFEPFIDPSFVRAVRQRKNRSSLEFYAGQAEDNMGKHMASGWDGGYGKMGKILPDTHNEREGNMGSSHAHALNVDFAGSLDMGYMVVHGAKVHSIIRLDNKDTNNRGGVTYLVDTSCSWACLKAGKGK